MKLFDLKKTITINAIILGVFIFILSIGIFIIFYQNKSSQEQSNKILNETESIKSKTKIMASKALEARKYKDLYVKIPKEKRVSFTGIKMDEINAKLKTIGDKYYISAREIKIAVPEALKDEPFKLKTFGVLTSTVNLTFKAYTEDRAFLFINEFMKSLNGFTILNNFEIQKDKDYSAEDLINISSGSGSGVITAKIDFYWYSFKEEDKTKSNGSRKITQPKTETPMPPNP